MECSHNLSVTLSNLKKLIRAILIHIIFLNHRSFLLGVGLRAEGVGGDFNLRLDMFSNIQNSILYYISDFIFDFTKN